MRTTSPALAAGESPADSTWERGEGNQRIQQIQRTEVQRRQDGEEVPDLGRDQQRRGNLAVEPDVFRLGELGNQRCARRGTEGGAEVISCPGTYREVTRGQNAPKTGQRSWEKKAETPSRKKGGGGPHPEPC